MVLVIWSSRNRILSFAIKKSALNWIKNYDKISLILGGGQGGLIFKIFFNFFQKLNPPLPGGRGGVKFTEHPVTFNIKLL